MQLSELIVILQGALHAHGDRKVLCTWEGITPEIDSVYITTVGNAKSIFASFEGELLIDCDGGMYKAEYAETVIWERPE